MSVSWETKVTRRDTYPALQRHQDHAGHAPGGHRSQDEVKLKYKYLRLARPPLPLSNRERWGVHIDILQVTGGQRLETLAQEAQHLQMASLQDSEQLLKDTSQQPSLLYVLNSADLQRQLETLSEENVQLSGAVDENKMLRRDLEMEWWLNGCDERREAEGGIPAEKPGARPRAVAPLSSRQWGAAGGRQTRGGAAEGVPADEAVKERHELRQEVK
ncbi:hypothetical protein O3P69_013063 [Scylla paramamosain]|uniref:Uncharacterized protein n=1 Tax=Scylla paramamosain TaxID=85552 RepID=A0AAW0TS64_SCYPA